jgi:putative addiction module component (TIGR02574 family)
VLVLWANKDTMAVNINELLDLPVEERRRIAKIIINSLPEDDFAAAEQEDDNEEELTKEQMEMLEERYERYKRGESRAYTLEEVDSYIRKKIQEQSGV